MVIQLLLTEKWPFKLSHSVELFTLQGMEFV